MFPEGSGNPIFALTRTPAGVNLWACQDDLTKDCRERSGEPGPAGRTRRNVESSNPLYELATREYDQNIGRFLGSAGLRISPVSWFDVDGSASYDRREDFQQDYYPKGFRTTQSSPGVNNGFLDQERFLDAGVQRQPDGHRSGSTCRTRSTTVPSSATCTSSRTWTTRTRSGYNFGVGDVVDVRQRGHHDPLGAQRAAARACRRLLPDHQLRHRGPVHLRRTGAQRRQLAVRRRPAPPVVLPPGRRLAAERGVVVRDAGLDEREAALLAAARPAAAPPRRRSTRRSPFRRLGFAARRWATATCARSTPPSTRPASTWASWPTAPPWA